MVKCEYCGKDIETSLIKHIRFNHIPNYVEPQKTKETKVEKVEEKKEKIINGGNDK